MDINEVYPKEDFEADMKERIYYGLILTVFVLPYLLAEEKPDFNVNMEDLSIKHGKVFKERFAGIINDFIKWGYL